VVACTLRPGERALRSVVIDDAAALSISAAASIVETELLIERRCSPPAVPVTTTDRVDRSGLESEINGDLAVRRDGRRSTIDAYPMRRRSTYAAPLKHLERFRSKIGPVAATSRAPTSTVV
jgi:hypothetical protein